MVESSGPLRPELGSHDLLVACEATRQAAVRGVPDGPLHVGVDLGTAFVVVCAVDGAGRPVAVASRAASVVRDGVVVEFAAAQSLVGELVAQVEQRVGCRLTTAATTYPPGVAPTEVRACRYVVEGAGLECTAMVDEPTAANAVLRVEDGAVVDVGGGTTGVAVLRDGQVVAVADEPTGGTHVSLVIAGHHRIPLSEAEALKVDPAHQPRLFGLVRPVFDKIATIVAGHLEGHTVDRIHLVGGSAAFPGLDRVVEELTGLPVTVPVHPLLVTPLGVALHDPGAATGIHSQTLEVSHG